VTEAANSDVTGVPGLARHFLGGVEPVDGLAYQIVLAESLDRRCSLQFLRDLFAFGQLSIGHFARL